MTEQVLASVVTSFHTSFFFVIPGIRSSSLDLVAEYSPGVIWYHRGSITCDKKQMGLATTKSFQKVPIAELGFYVEIILPSLKMRPMIKSFQPKLQAQRSRKSSIYLRLNLVFIVRESCYRVLSLALYGPKSHRSSRLLFMISLREEIRLNSCK